MRDLFIRFRRSNAFLFTLLTAAGLVWGAHEFYHFDPDWSVSNLWLSLEASFATCMLLDLALRTRDEDITRWDRIERILERMEKEVLDVAEEIDDLAHDDATAA